MRFDTLAEWLSWQETLHPRTIELGLERVGRVFQKLHPEPPPCKVITVAGTNGKGSTVALFEAIYASAGYRVGSYTSPHLFRYNERIRIAGDDIGTDELPRLLGWMREKIETALASGELMVHPSFFEVITGTALQAFRNASLDLAVLEVGLGGRLDATNAVDPDVCAIVSVALDSTFLLNCPDAPLTLNPLINPPRCRICLKME